MTTHQDITYIIGPTGIGKSNYAIQLAQEQGASIISADSYQVYRYLDIGTAKVSKEQQQLVPHHLIDIKMPNETYTVVEFLQLTETIINSERTANRPIIICGGSGLFSRSFLYRYQFPKAQSDPDIRDQLARDYDTKGKDALWALLCQKDPVSAKLIHPNNKHHLIRALEISAITGLPPSQLKQHSATCRPDTKVIGLTVPRTVVKERISTRVDMMITQGLVQEVESLLQRGFSQDLQSMKGIGYKEVIDYLNGSLDKNKMIDCIKLHTHQFSKRQMTWFKRIDNVLWKNISY
ncbi:tRNA (adenosine(37)-N6)-dimethylallyltransferase MiaA [Candidatus Marinamargulisbacteria bacterium SCGC AG-343-D04]|nr:tRNA (adenosine(37)-N6)-dimethylallyltransferase MiaA [Candidatus Marinamargulisbacteria bacterium SCGC AG-343-D04]